MQPVDAMIPEVQLVLRTGARPFSNSTVSHSLPAVSSGPNSRAVSWTPSMKPGTHTIIATFDTECANCSRNQLERPEIAAVRD